MTRKIHILLLICFCFILQAQVPYAFRYQASVRNEQNRPINNEVVFEIKLYADQLATNEVYQEVHVALPDTNGFVAFSIGEGLSNQDFKTVNWAEGPYFIQVLLDDEEISYSQLLSVPYALHAATASKLYDLQEPSAENDPTTKRYVDEYYTLLLDSINTLNSDLKDVLSTSKSYADSLSLAPKDLNIASAGDTLQIGSTKLVISGMSSENMPKYNQQICLGGSYNESINKVIKCADSSLLVIGNTLSGNGDIIDFKGEADIWVVKLDRDLNKQWTKTLGGSKYETASIVIEESDGFLIGGTTESSDNDISENKGEFDIWLVKLDLNGNITWQKTFGGSGTEFLNDIIKLSNGNYLVGATTFSNGGDITWHYGEADMWVFEIDNSKSIVKSVVIGGSKYDALQSIKVSDNGYNIYGSSASNDGIINKNKGELDYIKISLDHDLNIIGHYCFGNANNQQLIKTLVGENNTILGGQSFSASWGAGEGMALKNIFLSTTGNPSWNLELGGSNNDLLVDIKQVGDTSYILGQTASFDGDINEQKGGSDIWLAKISSDGKLLSEKTFGGSYDESAKIIKSYNQGWIIGGEAASKDKDLSLNAGEKDIWVIHLDHTLNITWQKTFGGSFNESLYDIIINDNSITLVGTTSSNDYSITGLHDKEGKSSDIWLLNTTLK